MPPLLMSQVSRVSSMPSCSPFTSVIKPTRRCLRFSTPETPCGSFPCLVESLRYIRWRKLKDWLQLEAKPEVGLGISAAEPIHVPPCL